MFPTKMEQTQHASSTMYVNNKKMTWFAPRWKSKKTQLNILIISCFIKYDVVNTFREKRKNIQELIAPSNIINEIIENYICCFCVLCIDQPRYDIEHQEIIPKNIIYIYIYIYESPLKNIYESIMHEYRFHNDYRSMMVARICE
jgi:hypothetical protein